MSSKQNLVTGQQRRIYVSKTPTKKRPKTCEETKKINAAATSPVRKNVIHSTTSHLMTINPSSAPEKDDNFISEYDNHDDDWLFTTPDVEHSINENAASQVSTASEPEKMVSTQRQDSFMNLSLNSPRTSSTATFEERIHQTGSARGVMSKVSSQEIHAKVVTFNKHLQSAGGGGDNSAGSSVASGSNVRDRSLLTQLFETFRMNALRQKDSPRFDPAPGGQVYGDTDVALESALAKAALIEDLNYSSSFNEEATFFGLPTVVKDLFEKHKGIKELYDWQVECLQLPAVQERHNLIYSLPTSGGKTLVAEILMWKEVLCQRKDAILILPYVSIVQEKVQAMALFAIDLNFTVEEYAGSKGQIPPRKHRNKHCIYITTIEKAHSLINVLVELNRIDEIGLVVVDEFHMIGDGGSRGATLECLLSKLLFISEQTMIIGMSATLGNIADLSKFLNADIYSRDFRPVELKEYVKVGNKIYSVNPSALCDEEMFTLCRTCAFSYAKEMIAQDPDYLGGLVMEVVPKNSCLIFCQSRKNCENVALLVCKMMPKELKEYKVKEKIVLLESLKSVGNGKMCPVLHRTIQYGVVYHHSGLTTDERRLLEEAYIAGTLCCITCTSTLAAGVNLPAKRVILRSPYVGTEFLTRSQLKQMIGRAGRAGIDTSGESILIVKPGDERKCGELLRAEVEQCRSSLLYEGHKGLKMLLLSAFGLEIIKTEDDAVRLVSKTLYSIQNRAKMDTDIQTVVATDLVNLKEAGFLECHRIKTVDGVSGDQIEWKVSRLGRATFKGSIDLDCAKALYTDLKIGLQALALNSHLHLLYLVTPYDLTESTNPTPNIYYDVYMSLPPEELEVAKLIGITEGCIVNVSMGKKAVTVSEAILRRFYLTLVLHDTWQQNSMWDVAHKFEMPRGHVQNLLTNSAAFASSVLHFCQELDDLWAYQDLLATFGKRLSHCVHMELIPLMELPCIKQGRARLLYSAGYKSLDVLAQSDPEELVRKVPHMPRKVAREVVTAAKVLVLQQADALREEADDLMIALNNSVIFD